ncbi:hypothetical protein BHM03_00026248, partial [Ensete ventricosum]
FSVTEHFKSDDTGRLQSVPGVFFFYDLSPIKLRVSFRLSGIFTVSGILDSFIYHGQRAIKKKMEIGKFS